MIVIISIIEYTTCGPAEKHHVAVGGTSRFPLPCHNSNTKSSWPEKRYTGLKSVTRQAQGSLPPRASSTMLNTNASLSVGHRCLSTRFSTTAAVALLYDTLSAMTRGQQKPPTPHACHGRETNEISTASDTFNCLPRGKKKKRRKTKHLFWSLRSTSFSPFPLTLGKTLLFRPFSSHITFGDTKRAHNIILKKAGGASLGLLT